MATIQLLADAFRRFALQNPEFRLFTFAAPDEHMDAAAALVDDYIRRDRLENDFAVSFEYDQQNYRFHVAAISEPHVLHEFLDLLLHTALGLGMESPFDVYRILLSFKGADGIGIGYRVVDYQNIWLTEFIVHPAAALQLYLENVDTASEDDNDAEEHSSLSPAALAGKLILSPKTLAKYAKNAGVETPGRGQRNFIYKRDAVLAICREVADKYPNPKQRNRAANLLTEMGNKP